MLNEHITIGKQGRHRVYVRDWQKSRTKVKSDARQQKQNSGRHYRVLHILFLYNGEKEFRIMDANASKKFL
jgi:hypothetical protein